MTTAIYTGRTHEGLSPDGEPIAHRGEKGLCPAPECRAARIPALALTVQQPWADKIAHDSKRTENRVWPVPPKHIGATIMIHAGLVGDRRAVLDGIEPGPDLRGFVIATARLAGCHRDRPGLHGSFCCPQWGQRGVWHWDLDDVQALPMPITARGAQKLWRPQASLIEAVRAQQQKGTLS